jgi:hypothetical protein
MIQPPPPLGTDWKVWGERLTAFLSTTRDKLRSLTSGESASDDGILMWDRIDKNPVVSIDGEWIPLGLGGGTNSGSHAYVYSTTSQIASVINGSDSTRIDFAKGGTFYINFHATLASSNASTKTVYFFPKINGTTQDHSTIITTLHENGQKKIASRNGLFTVSAGDYLQAMWATDDVAAWLENNTATSFAPSTPSVTLSIVEVTT